MDCCSFWSLNVLDIQPARKGLIFFFPPLHPLFYGVSISFNIPVIVLDVCLHVLWLVNTPWSWQTWKQVSVGRKAFFTGALGRCPYRTGNGCIWKCLQPQLVFSPGGRFELSSSDRSVWNCTQRPVIPRGLLINSLGLLLKGILCILSLPETMSSSSKKCLLSPGRCYPQWAALLPAVPAAYPHEGPPAGRLAGWGSEAFSAGRPATMRRAGWLSLWPVSCLGRCVVCREWPAGERDKPWPWSQIASQL